MRQLEIYGLVTYKQPSGSFIQLQYGENPEGWWCERRVNAHLQEDWRRWDKDTIKRVVKDWEKFEDRIGSFKL